MGGRFLVFIFVYFLVVELCDDIVIEGVGERNGGGFRYDYYSNLKLNEI